MKASHRLTRSWPLLAAALLPAHVHADAAYDAVLKCMHAQVPATLRVQAFTLTSVDRSGDERRLGGRLFADRKGGQLRVLMRLDEPASVKGAAYLIREFAGKAEDDMYVFLPGVGRVRHITGSFANGSLLGTDFSYAEAKLIRNGYTGANGRLEGEAEIDGRKVQQLSIRQTASAASPYSTIKVWVEPTSCVAVKAEFYEGEKLRKRLRTPPASLAQSDGHWYPALLEMEDFTSGTRTTLRAGRYQTDAKPNEGLFDPQRFHRGG